MTHKMYRYLKGYENALSLTFDTLDEIDNLINQIKLGDSANRVMGTVVEIEKLLSLIKKEIKDDGSEGND
ncbi:hypothetical protein P8825_15430 [Shouchella clausii]|uniref:hypothetical protein n=1 Tax=Shouchella clausii TaxID=79880 RepID=UPI002DBF4C24|nr:hypothetical protein [Shouchella clausii]MEB5480957.1 hypothetical protein [Shouchella clausii]